MKARRLLAITLYLFALSAAGAGQPYKEPMHSQVQSKQPVVYARVADHGFGVQYSRDMRTGASVGGLVGAVAGSPLGQVGTSLGQILGTELGRVAGSGSTRLAQQDAEKLAPLFDHAAAQRDLEDALLLTLPTVALFTAPIILKTLAPGELAVTAVPGEDPLLVIELYASLITDYRGLQVSAVVYELSGAHGRVYRNRFDYVSDLLPAPAIKTREQVKADVEAVKAKYVGRKLSRAEQQQRALESREAAKGTTLAKWREPLMDEWLASGGARLRQALRLGTIKVVELFSKDLLDFSTVTVSPVDVIGWRTLRDVESGRYTTVFIGGPFAGALMSEPSGLSVGYCQGTAFRPLLAQSPQLCAEEISNYPMPKKGK
jgi:hypothetical protein